MAGNYFIDWAYSELDKLQKKLDVADAAATAEVGKEADAYAMRVMAPIAKQHIGLLYRNAVDAWYSAYMPKDYKRKYSLYDVLQFSPGQNNVAWSFVDDGLNKPSWSGKKSINIYELVFEGGSHGHAYGSFVPVVSTPIPDMFGPEEKRAWEDLQQGFDNTGQEYFNTYIDERVALKFAEMFG